MNLPGERIVNSLRLSYRQKRLDTRASLVSTYRCSLAKPEKISSGKFALFHRPKVIWTLVQIAGISAVALWTIRNYVHIIKSL